MCWSLSYCITIVLCAMCRRLVRTRNVSTIPVALLTLTLSTLTHPPSPEVSGATSGRKILRTSKPSWIVVVLKTTVLFFLTPLVMTVPMTTTIPKNIIATLQTEARTLNQEVGYVFEPDPALSGNVTIARRIESQVDGQVTIPGNHPLTAHTHPVSLYGDLKYHPPSDMDYLQSVWNHISGVAEWSVVVEPRGCWAYRPKESLVTLFLSRQPTLKADLGQPMKEASCNVILMQMRR